MQDRTGWVQDEVYSKELQVVDKLVLAQVGLYSGQVLLVDKMGLAVEGGVHRDEEVRVEDKLALGQDGAHNE